MIGLAKTTVASPDFYSTGDGSDPVSVSLTLDGTSSPTHVTASPATALYVWADDDTTNIDNYSGVGVAIVGADAGIVWELSLNGSTGWGPSISLSDMNVAVAHATTQIFARATAINDGTVLTANYTTADVKITALENPAA